MNTISFSTQTEASEVLPQPELATFNSLPDLIRQWGAVRGKHPAIVCDGVVVSFSALDAMIDRCTASLQRDGVVPGDAIAICATNSINYAVVFFGALRAGAVVAPLSPAAHPDSLAGMISNSGAFTVFVDESVAQLLSLVKLPDRIRIIRIDTQDFEDFLTPTGTLPTHVEIQRDWAFNIIYSSGTTGVPKGIVQSHGMRHAFTVRSAERGYGPSAKVLISTPLYSHTTLVSFFPTLGLGGTVILMTKFDASQYLELAQRYRATHTMMVPVQYQRLLEHPDFDRHDLSALRTRFCTSAPFSAAIKAEILRRWPGELTEFYGMTEGGATCELRVDQHPEKLHTVGMPIPGDELRVIDSDGRELAQGEVGEFVGRSPAMMTGYYKEPDKSAEVEWHDREGRRFIRTGDVGRFDDDGFVVLMDRRKDLIISGGFNLYPSDLEHILASHAGVSEVAVIGVPSARWGETPVAFVTLRAGERQSRNELLAWANERLGKMQRLADVVIVDSLPRSPIGKVLKRELRDRYDGAVA
ncbi:class I adenylate-forming enzyme family protein [Burkholderia cepacia]|uniref:class I adenylate-forming enzyme family protein n=1 Tax=Burkholderia cepacia TaxID=292 RepID=UPI001589EE86|nr:class I adenylate-forming enzyme family protein [Burkholderia cepacia]